MCHGHPHCHSCGHQSVTWHYCPSALIDLETGYETPCPNITFAGSQASTASCPLANCDYSSAGGGGWTCCQCGGRNTSGWCTNLSPAPKWERNSVTNEWEWIERCDHGCCRSCIKDRKFDCASEGVPRSHPPLGLLLVNLADTAAASENPAESSRKGGGKKGKESRKHRQTASSVAGGNPVASYSIMLDYSGTDAKSSSRKHKAAESTSHRKK